MRLLKRIVMAGVVALLGAGSASANGGISAGQFAGQSQGGHSGGLPFFRRTPVPAFQAAPWYLYWPYNAHFQTPAPLTGAYYGPPGSGMGGMVNPYYASPNYGYGATAYPATMPQPPAAPQVMPQTIPGGTLTPAPVTPMPAPAVTPAVVR